MFVLSSRMTASSAAVESAARASHLPPGENTRRGTTTEAATKRRRLVMSLRPPGAPSRRLTVSACRVEYHQISTTRLREKGPPMFHYFRRRCRHPLAVLGFLLVLAAATASPVNAARKPAAESGSEWPEITPAERAMTKVEQDPEADAVVLINDRSGRIAPMSNGQWVNQMVYQWRLKVLTERGKSYGEVSLRADKYSRISNLRARSLKADGTIVPVTPDQMFEKVLLQVGKYKLTETVFKFPSVEPGAILEYRFERYNNNLVYIS